MQPTQNQVHVDRVLTNISVAYIQSAEDFIAGRAFPELPVVKQSDIYFKYNKDDWFRDEAKQRSDGAPTAYLVVGVARQPGLPDPAPAQIREALAARALAWAGLAVLRVARPAQALPGVVGRVLVQPRGVAVGGQQAHA